MKNYPIYFYISLLILLIQNNINILSSQIAITLTSPISSIYLASNYKTIHLNPDIINLINQSFSQTTPTVTVEFSIQGNMSLDDIGNVVVDSSKISTSGSITITKINATSITSTNFASFALSDVYYGNHKHLNPSDLFFRINYMEQNNTSTSYPITSLIGSLIPSFFGLGAATISNSFTVKFNMTFSESSPNYLYFATQNAFTQHLSSLSISSINNNQLSYTSMDGKNSLTLAIWYHSQPSYNNPGVFSNILNLYAKSPNAAIWTKINSTGDTPLLSMVKNNFDTNFITQAANAGGATTLSQQNTNDKSTPLHVAIQNFSTRTDVEKFSWFQNILNLCIQSNNPSIWTTANNQGDTPLLAMIKNNFNINSITQAVNAGGATTLGQQNTNDKSTPLHVAIQNYINKTMAYATFETILQICIKSNNPSIWTATNKQGDTPLLTMIKTNFDINSITQAANAGGVTALGQQNTNDKSTPLHVAIQNYIYKTMTYATFETILQICIKSNNPSIWTATNNLGNTPLNAMINNVFDINSITDAANAGGTAPGTISNINKNIPLFSAIQAYCSIKFSSTINKDEWLQSIINYYNKYCDSSVWTTANLQNFTPLSLIAYNIIQYNIPLSSFLTKLPWSISINIPRLLQSINQQKVFFYGSFMLNDLYFLNSNNQQLSTLSQNYTTFLTYLNTTQNNQVIGIISKDRLSIIFYYPKELNTIQSINFTSSQPISSINHNIYAPNGLQLLTKQIPQTTDFLILHKSL